MEICKYCGKEFEKKLSLAAHIGHCKSKPNFINRDYHLSSKKAALKRKLIIENKIAEGDSDYTYKYLDYVINKYGNDFIKLYDGYNPKLDIKNQKYVFVHNDK